MARRDQDSSTLHGDGSKKNYEPYPVVVVDKVAIVDADMLYHVALNTIDNTAPLEAQKENLEKVVEGFESTLVAKGYVYFVKGIFNFRNVVATIKPYKGNRKSEPHPFAKEIFEHLVQFRNCIKSDGFEADDMVSILHSDKTIVCTSDKDAKQNKGSIYDLRKRVLIEVSEEEAWYNLWLQVLTGDTVDNIPGIEGCGPKSAEKILSDKHPDDYPKYVLNAYINKYGRLDGSDFFNENYQLIRMKSMSGAYIAEQYKEIKLLIDQLYEL